MERPVKKRIFDIIQIGNKSDFPSRFFDYFIVAVIFLNITLMLLETFSEFDRYSGLMETVERITVLVFMLEYILRIWTAEYLYPQESRRKAIRHFIFSFEGIVDLLTILPFFFLSGFVVFRLMRVVRILHLFRLNQQYDSFHVITSVLTERKNQIASSIFIILVLVIAASLFMYNVEHDVQPEAFKNAFSGVWWAVSTLLTVGYGDIYPITTLGRAMAIVIAFLGVMAVAIPTGIISAGFVDQYNKMSASDAGQKIPVKVVTIEVDSSWIGRSVEEIQKSTGYKIIMVRNDKETVPAFENKYYHICRNDRVMIFDPEQSGKEDNHA